MAQPALEPTREPAPEPLGWAILRTRAYFSLFGYTPTLFELHRYLHGEPATVEQVRAASRRLGSQKSALVPYPRPRSPRSFQGTTVPGPTSRPAARRLRFYIALLKHLPFVRMIGLTGSRAIQPGDGGDTDLMIVTSPGRVWLCRLAVVALTRLAGCFGDRLCPNYVASEDCLALADVTIYDAHELAQLVPLYGGAAYHQLWDLNPRVRELLPNAHPFPCPNDRLLPGAGLLKRAAEWALSGRLGHTLERWERERKIARLQARGAVSPEISLTAEQCKGHFDGHKSRILFAYRRIVTQLEEA
ncbi:MAG TPA: hypothetical protein VNL71_04995 [Chloroflexota bacterium]|nr:hypothetical protein [Chloroflexota bacterium]